MLTIVIASDWKAFEDYCARHNLDHTNRKVVVPLIGFGDKYRLWGRNLRNAKVMKVGGEIRPDLMSAFKHELKKSGWGKDDAA
jgi:hypothetical protein